VQFTTDYERRLSVHQQLHRISLLAKMRQILHPLAAQRSRGQLP
jgi:hypothetical protein